MSEETVQANEEIGGAELSNAETKRLRFYDLSEIEVISAKQSGDSLIVDIVTDESTDTIVEKFKEADNLKEISYYVGLDLFKQFDGFVVFESATVLEELLVIRVRKKTFDERLREVEERMGIE